MTDLTAATLAKASPLTQEIAGLVGDLSANEIAWIDERISAQAAENERLRKALATSLPKVAVMLTALKRIKSLDAKNVPKYAQQIAVEAINQQRLNKD